MKLSRVIRLIGAVALMGGIGVAIAVPAGADPLQGHGHEGSWGHQGSGRFPIGPGFFQPPATCTGTLNAPGVLAGTYRSSVVVNGVCAVDGGAATILGNLTLSPGSALNATFALNDLPGGSGTSSLTVYGSVTVLNGAVLAMGCEANFSPCSDDPAAATGGTLTGSNHVFGSLNSWSPLGVIVHTSTINGNVTEVGGGGGLSCNPPTTGIFSLLQSPVFSDYEDNSVGGYVAVAGVQTCWMGMLRNTVQGSIYDLFNTFGDPDANEVLSNTVQQNMWCYGNNPQVQYGDAGGVPNQVAGRAVGECGFGVLQPNPAPTPTSPAGPLAPISVKS
jgi:hypothetical protein